MLRKKEFAIFIALVAEMLKNITQIISLFSH